MSSVLIIDDDRTVLEMVRHCLAKLEVKVITGSSADEAVQLVRQHKPDVVLLDILMPGMSGLQVFTQIHELDRRLPVIFVTADVGSETAIEAMQLGAYDYVAKPLDLPKLTALVEQALETRRLMNVPVAVPVREDDEPGSGDLFIGRSPEMLDVFKLIGRVAKQNITVLIRGESGTGKELVARALYQFSDRANRPFMAVNCAALPDTLLESELFGHKKGAFTGADRDRVGKFEQCNGGTIFLDEVGDMSPLVQSKVLRLLQEQRFERVGSNEMIQTDVRIISATNQPLEEMVENGDFREDLIYRLNGVTIALPPLRERTEDIALLLQHYLTRARKDLNKPEIEGISPDALRILQEYDWPGNVRELQSVVRQSVLHATGSVIVPEFLPAEVYPHKRVNHSAPAATLHAESAAPGALDAHPDIDHFPSSDLKGFVESRLACGSTDLYAESVQMLERYLFARVLLETKGNQTKTAETLGITRGKVRARIAAFGISLDKIVSLQGDQ